MKFESKRLSGKKWRKTFCYWLLICSRDKKRGLMISVNIAFDNRDAELGEFFRQCKDDLITFLNDNDASDEYDVHEMHSGLCNMAYLDNRMPLINANNFLFIAYSHGEDNCLLAGGTAYIDSNHYSNVHLFTNSFF